MNKKNYDSEMQKIISELKERGEKPKLLMHACCAPCASACIEKVKDYFDLTVYFYNPNMDGKDEYRKRADELIRLCGATGVNCVIEEYLPEDYDKVIAGLEKEPEGGSRCKECFLLRLNKTAEKAKKEGFNYFATTLTVSPLKNAELINGIGYKVGEKTGVDYLPSDFKKRAGYLRSIELSKEYGLYRQNYCGCEYSKR